MGDGRDEHDAAVSDANAMLDDAAADDDDDERRRVDEADALRAIYGEDDVRVTVRARGEVEISMMIETASRAAACALTLPVGYPSARPPERARVTFKRGRDARAMEIERSLQGEADGTQFELWERELRECCAYAWFERAREALERLDATVGARIEKNESEGVGAREELAVETEDSSVLSVRARLTSHEPVTVKKSVFQAHVCSDVRSVEDVEIVMRVLLQNKKIREATHNILAYRISRREEGRSEEFYQDSDDDGESAAGGRLLRLLVLADARDVVVVVTRWYGGVHLGPARFHVINSTAKTALESLGVIHNNSEQ